MFDNAVDSAAADSQIKLVNAEGRRAVRQLDQRRQPAPDRIQGCAGGRYTVIVAPAMADTSGKTVGSELVGPVYVH